MNCRVLIVDDNRDAADMLAMLLSALGHTTSVAYHGRHALSQLGMFNPDIIILDMNMPVMDGYETARIVRSLPNGGNVRIIALTANSNPAAVDRMMKAGCNATLTKPSTAQKILELFY